MKRFTATWMTAAASAVLLTLPATGFAQTPPTPPPATAQPPATTPAGAQAGTTATGDQSAAQEHLRKATAALEEVKTATLPAKAKTQVAEIKRRLTSLERTAAAGDKASATAQANRSPKAKNAANWGTEVAAIDKALTALLGPAETTGATGTTGTSGATPAAPNKAAASITLDADTRASLTEVRTHVTAYATAMAGGTTGSETTSPAASAATGAEPTGTSSTPPAASQPPTGTSPASQPPTGTAPTSQPPTAPPAGAPPASSDPATSPQSPGMQPTDPGEEAARRHLIEARNTLSAMTQLPAAAQLTGEARTQVAQLISNFNELITTQSQWRDSYTKVTVNLTSLLGPETGATDPAATSGTPGAVGTSGSTPANLDPAVREKLVELRRNLTAFEKAAGGEGTAVSSTAPADPTSTTGSATGTSSATGSATSPATTSPTSPSTPATTASPTISTTEPATEAATGASSADVARHIAAIEGLLKMQDDSGGLTLTKAQVEQLRTHWTALRQAIDKK